MDVSDGDMILDLTECVTDADNIDANIKLSLLEPPLLWQRITLQKVMPQ